MNTPAPELPTPLTSTSEPTPQTGGIKLPGMRDYKEKVTQTTVYDRKAWKAEVPNVEIYLRDLIGVDCYYCTSNERQEGVIVSALAKHGSFVWCRTQGGELIVVAEDHLHSLVWRKAANVPRGME